jgi:repressor LexA
MDELTPKQHKILSFIEDYFQKNTHSPSFQEIQAHFGFASPRAATKHVQAIIKKGLLESRKSGKKRIHRGLLPLRPMDNEVPLLGRIAAGAPIEAIENVSEKLDLSSLGINNSKKEYFALTVKGDSMINAHILDGDWVIIKRQSHVTPSEVAAVLWNDEATLKHVKRMGTSVLLIPENDNLKPILVAPEKVSAFQVLGKVVRVIRRC